MKIKRGRYTLADRNLVLDIDSEFDLSGSTCQYILCGENGTGKSSFLEKILVPALGSSGIDFLFVGQDIRYQLYTLRALLAAMGLSVIGADEKQLLRVWIDHSPTARVLVLDEFDKYFSDFEFMFQWTNERIRFCFVVTHNDPPIDLAGSQHFGSVRIMHFEPIGWDGPLKRVRIFQEQP